METDEVDMWDYLWPVLMVVGANTFYHICAKSTPEAVNPFASLSITYSLAAICSVILFYAAGEHKTLLAEMGRANWTSYLFGMVIVWLEFGYICMYRAGWKVSVGSLVSNIGLACVLLAVGVLVYKEAVSFRQILGILMCMGGLFLLTE